MKKSGIYKIINLINNKFYIGSSIDLDNRFKNHIAMLNKNTHINIKLQRAWNKYGQNNFIFHIIEFCSSNKCLELEQFYLNSIMGFYNIASNASAPMTNRKHNQKTLDKLKGRKCWNKGIKRTEAEKLLMSKNRKLAYQNMDQKSIEIWKQKIRQNPNKYWTNKKLPEEMKQKISDFWKNKNNFNLLCEQNNKLYSTQLEAAKDLKIKQGHISEHLNDKRSNVFGYTFKKVLKNV